MAIAGRPFTATRTPTSSHISAPRCTHTPCREWQGYIASPRSLHAKAVLVEQSDWIGEKPW